MEAGNVPHPGALPTDVLDESVPDPAQGESRRVNSFPKHDARHKYGTVNAAGNSRVILGNVYYIYPTAAEGKEKQPKFPSVMQVLRYEDMTVKRDFSMPKDSYLQEWIWKTSFADWLQSSSKDPYWISGKAGSGKSTLCAHVCLSHNTKEYLGEQYEIIYFFYDYRAGKALANTITGMLRMLLYQLADQHKGIKAKLQEMLELEILAGEEVSLFDSPEALLQTVCQVISSSKSKYCIFIDGLDEYEGNQRDLMNTCRRIKNQTGAKLCLICRPDVQVSDVFELFGTIKMQDYNRTSMKKYAEEEILRVNNDRPDIDLLCTEEVRDELIKKAEGIVLWFKLSFDQLLVKCVAGNSSKKDVEEFIKDIPLGLDGLYQRSLASIPEARRPEAALILYLVRKLRDLHEKADMFATTDLDHLAETYDYVANQVGDAIGLRKLKDYDDMRDRIEKHLHGLLTCQEFEKDDNDLPSTTNLDIRYIHKTFQAFIQKPESEGFKWVQAYLPKEVEQFYPDEFWLRFFTNIIEQATDDGCFTEKELLECLRELTNMMEASDDFEWKHVSKIVKRLATQPRSYLLALAQDLCPSLIERAIKEDIISSSDDESMPVRLLVTTMKSGSLTLLKWNKRLTFNQNWRTRHAILRSSMLMLGTLCQECEEAGKSTYPFLSKALSSRFGMIVTIEPYEDAAAPRWVLDTLFGRDALEVRDLVAAMVCGLELYSKDRLADKPLSSTQMEALVRALIAWTIYREDESNCDDWAEILVEHGGYLSKENLCFFFMNARCCDDAAEATSALRRLIKASKGKVDMSGGCSHGSPVLHWAQFSCLITCEYCEDSDHGESYWKLLEPLLTLGADINALCYPGGTAFQAIFDHTITPLSGRKHLQRKDKFVALVKRGFNPQIDTPHGRALQSAKDYLDAPWWKRGPQVFNKFVRKDFDDESQIRFIIVCLMKFNAEGFWPDTEELKLDVIEYDSSDEEAAEDGMSSVSSSPPPEEDESSLETSSRTTKPPAPLKKSSISSVVMLPRTQGSESFSGENLTSDNSSTPLAENDTRGLPLAGTDRGEGRNALQDHRAALPQDRDDINQRLLEKQFPSIDASLIAALYNDTKNLSTTREILHDLVRQ